MKSRTGALFGLLLASAAFGMAGFVIGTIRSMDRSPHHYPFLAERVPLPHSVPAIEGGVTLRFAMVHDVLTERFPKHGKAWYEHRNADITTRLSAENVSKQERWSLTDDLAVGYDKVGAPQKGVEILRVKLQEQEADKLLGGELYTSYANLGTTLIHANFQAAQSGDPQAQSQLEEGVSMIRKSVEVNPSAHFGREKWQAVIAEFLLASFRKPELLTQFDCVGNRLDLDIETILNREHHWTENQYGRANTVFFTNRLDSVHDVPRFFEPGVDHTSPTEWRSLSPIREFVTRIGAEDGWNDVDVPSHRSPVCFDEPVIGIIGMWREGGGANPHFALALGEIMLRTGQRFLSWSAFERALMLSNRYSPDPATQQFLLEHCRKRQTQIELSLRPSNDSPETLLPPWQEISGPVPSEVVDQLRSSFTTDLNAGLQFQKELEQFEDQQFAAGRKIGDPEFFDGFGRERSSIATPVGLEETVMIVRPAAIQKYTNEWRNACIIFSAGIGATLFSLFDLFRSHRRSRIRAAEVTNPNS
ncbi:MAG: hypothetical protein JNL58_28935 [Planctomyces sp.]|nr:hypothetical protein [Planctomyces sp.]